MGEVIERASLSQSCLSQRKGDFVTAILEGSWTYSVPLALVEPHWVGEIAFGADWVIPVARRATETGACLEEEAFEETLFVLEEVIVVPSLRTEVVWGY